jgi:hypothetical protein
VARWQAKKLPAIGAYLCARLVRSFPSGRLSIQVKELSTQCQETVIVFGLVPAIDQGTRTAAPGPNSSGTASQASDPARVGQQVRRHAEDNALNSATGRLRPRLRQLVGAQIMLICVRSSRESIIGRVDQIGGDARACGFRG